MSGEKNEVHLLVVVSVANIGSRGAQAESLQSTSCMVHALFVVLHANFILISVALQVCGEVLDM